MKTKAKSLTHQTGGEHKICIICAKKFHKYDKPSWYNMSFWIWEKQQCCSMSCSIKTRKGRKATKETREKMRLSRLGRKPSGKTRFLISKNNARYWLGKKNLAISGENSPHWKGDDILYQAKHIRIRKQLGTPSYCEICKRTDRKKYVWSNKDHKYNLNIGDWQRLCEPCHKKYDKENN